MKRLSISRRIAGFTLTEVLVSSALIVGIMALMLTTVDQTRRTISNTTSRVSQFQSARIAFEAMTRNLGQATLNTYYDLDRSGDANQNPFGYRRQSDLHFVSGRADQAKLLGGSSEKGSTPRDSAHFPGHAVFFQAPLGVTALERQRSTTGGAATKQREYRSLTNLLCAVGYYVQWDEDRNRPNFLEKDEKSVPKRFRYRLMQVQQPAESLMVYTDINYSKLTSEGLVAKPGVGYANATDWIKVATGMLSLPEAFKEPEIPRLSDSSRVLAENVVALIIMPKVPERDRQSPEKLDDLTEDYEYDTCPKPAFDSQKREFSETGSDLQLMNIQRMLDEKARKQLHQLPPILQVTMVAIDEESGMKLADHSEEPPDWMAGRFSRLTTYEQFMKDLGDPAKPATDSLVYRIGNPDRKLPTPSLKYRVFTTEVVLRGSKWSQ